MRDEGTGRCGWDQAFATLCSRAFARGLHGCMRLIRTFGPLAARLACRGPPCGPSIAEDLGCLACGVPHGTKRRASQATSTGTQAAHVRRPGREAARMRPPRGGRISRPTAIRGKPQHPARPHQATQTQRAQARGSSRLGRGLRTHRSMQQEFILEQAQRAWATGSRTASTIPGVSWTRG